MTKSSSIFLKAAASVLLVTVLAWQSASGSYSSIYVFGDGVCTTTATLSPSNLYFGSQGQKRYSNGPVWTETLSHKLGVPYNAAKNNSYYGHITVELKTNATNFVVAPADAANSLFIVWTNNADFVIFANDLPWQTSSLTTWNTRISQSINDLTASINTLYAKGARKIVMPNAVNIAAIPLYKETTRDTAFFRNRVIDYNNQFLAATTNLMNTKPDLVIYRPDIFAYFEDVIGNPGTYGFTNATDAATSLSNTSFTGPGANYVFWDYWHPTTKFHDLLADFVQLSLPQPDTLPPVITLPGNLVKAVTSAGGASVTFTTSAIDAVDGPVTSTALPASGSTFPVGTTTVNVSASDAAGNVANNSFTVTVVNMNGLLKNVSITPAAAGSPAITGLIQGGPPSGEVILQASTDLGISDSWRDLSTIQLDVSGNQSFGPIQDPQGAGLERDFFRIKLPVTPNP